MIVSIRIFDTSSASFYHSISISILRVHLLVQVVIILLVRLVFFCLLFFLLAFNFISIIKPVGEVKYSLRNRASAGKGRLWRCESGEVHRR